MNTIDYSSEHITKLKNLIVGHLTEKSSSTAPITFQNLWETLNGQFKNHFEEKGITQEVFAKVCIFLNGKSVISQIANGDPTIRPGKTLYYV